MATYPASAREAIHQLQELTEALALRERREAALEELYALAELARGQPEGAPLRLVTVRAAVGERRERLELLLPPSIFAPEAWAYTFLEGLLKVPLDEYDGKRLVEVGTGSGWICLALAKFTRLAHIHGVDLNPHAAWVATCNAWLNGDEHLVARLSFGESDLLRGLPEGEAWDFVVGCIPQVLRTEGLPETPGEAEPEALYDLSNYTVLQNVYEDHFGLGLIARLLDEVPERLASGGRVLLNLAGRPGRPIIERMFTRRGFGTQVRVARRVMQAADTDIRPLVTLEQRTGREFEFFMEAHSPESLCAATALGWLQAGHPIWHEVAVWEARLGLPRETLALRSALRSLGVARLAEELDLGAVSQEQLGFVAALAERLARSPTLPYAHEAGDASFRGQVARYLERFFDLRLPEEAIFVAPEREQAVYSLLLALCDPGEGVLVSRELLPVYSRALERAGVKTTVTHSTLAEIHRLLGAFEVKVVFLSVAPGERTNEAVLRDIVAEAARRGIWVVVDESAFFHITSEVEPLTLFEFLAREPLPPNLVVLYGLIKNAVWPDLELTLLLPVPEPLRGDLEVAADVTYSRISTLAQWFYERTFADLLAFRISFAEPERPLARRAPDVRLPRSERIQRVSAFPAFAPKPYREEDADRVRLDYGENEAPLPQVLVEGLIAALAAPREAGQTHGLAEAVAGFLLETRGTRYGAEEIVLGQGVWPLLHHLGVALRRRLGRAPRVFVTTPCYAVQPPTWVAAGCEVELGPLAALLERRGPGRPDVVAISQPSNPEGCYLTHEELVALATWTVEQRALLVSDEIFGLLNLTNPTAETVHSPVTLEQAVPGVGARTVVLGGLSKEFAAGGLRLGWLATRDRALVQALHESGLVPPTLETARAAAWLYAAYARSADGRRVYPARYKSLREFLVRMRRELAEKRELISEALPGDGRSDTTEAGGLFLAPRMGRWLGLEIEGERLTVENLPRVVYAHTHVVLNGGEWCGEPERVRVVFSIPRDKLERARERLKDFVARLRPPPSSAPGYTYQDSSDSLRKRS